MKQTTFYNDPQLRREFAELCASKGVSVSYALRQLMREYIAGRAEIVIPADECGHDEANRKQTIR